MVWICSEIASEGVQDPWLWQRQTFILCSWAKNTEDRDFIIGQQTRDLYSHDGRSDSVSSEGLLYIYATFYKLLLCCQWSRINTNNFHAVIFFPFLMGPLKGSSLCLERRGSNVSKQQYNTQSVTVTPVSGRVWQSQSRIFLSAILPWNQNKTLRKNVVFIKWSLLFGGTLRFVHCDIIFIAVPTSSSQCKKSNFLYCNGNKLYI